LLICILHSPTYLNRAHLAPVVGPAAKLHLAVLVVEGEPGDVDLAGGLEDAGRDVGAAPLARQHHVRRVGPVKSLIGTKRNKIIIFKKPFCSSWAFSTRSPCILDLFMMFKNT
jgi:hypothetical protein